MDTSIDRLLELAVEAQEVPGVVALAVDQHGLRYAGAAGSRQAGGAADMTLDSVFWMASMTKPITSVAVMQLVEQGKVTLDEPLVERLPELSQVQVLDGFDEAGGALMRAPRRAITLRHLLTHTAGFAYPIWNAQLLRWQQSIDAPSGPLNAPMVADPGERWEYSISLDWVGRLVEHLSGQSLDVYFGEHILGPLGMGDTGFVVWPEQRARLASRHQRLPDGSLQAADPVAAPAPTFFSGGGGLHSTGPDYVRFLRMLLGQGQLDGARILRPETVADLGRNHLGELNVQVMRSVLPESSNDADLHPGMVSKWGLAGIINTLETSTGRSANSWAWAGLANTYFWVDPTRRLAGLLLTQILPFFDPAPLRLFERFERAVYAAGAPS